MNTQEFLQIITSRTARVGDVYGIARANFHTNGPVHTVLVAQDADISDLPTEVEGIPVNYKRITIPEPQ